jgi:endonuclease-8
LRALEGEVVSVRAPHPRAAALGIAERLDGRRLENVEAVGKNLLLTFEDGVVVRSNLRMRGRWRVQPVGSRVVGTPWLILRGGDFEAVLWNGPVLELGRRAVARLGPDIMLDPPDLDGMVKRLRGTDQRREIGDALLDQRLVAGVGNIWRSEGSSRPGSRRSRPSTSSRTRSFAASSARRPRRCARGVRGGSSTGGPASRAAAAVRRSPRAA